MAYPAMRWVGTSTDNENIAFELRLAESVEELIVYRHDHGDVRGFIKAMHPSAFFIEYSQDPDKTVLLIENEIKMRKSELLFLKKMIPTAIDFWQD